MSDYSAQEPEEGATISDPPDDAGGGRPAKSDRQISDAISNDEPAMSDPPDDAGGGRP